LGLSGQVEEAKFLALCDGKNPETQDWLTQRKNTTRAEDGKEVANRRVFFDFVFRPPKSVSILAYLHDERVLECHRKAVAAALEELERYAATRVRRGGSNAHRRTENITAALFEHDTSREQDPLLHTHSVIFNATFDGAEDRWKALETCDIFRAKRLVSAVYDQALTAGIVQLGYGIAREGQSWEVANISGALIAEFSQRRRQIEEEVERLRPWAETQGLDLHALRDFVALEYRKRKIRDADKAELRATWLRRASALGWNPAALREGVTKPFAVAAGVLAWAKDFVFERKSVAQVSDVEAAALSRCLGTEVDLAALRSGLAGAGILREDGSDRVVSDEGLARELDIVAFAREQRGCCMPINAEFDAAAAGLDAEQGAAVTTLLGCTDRVMLFRGVAGAGKSYTLKRLCDGVRATKQPLTVAAPQASQARDLVKDGLPAVTVAKLLTMPQLPAGSVVVVDEAGQIGGRQMQALMRLVRDAGGRLILSGDSRQHGAVEASDALISLERYGRLTMAEVRTVRRQDPDRARSDEERDFITLYRDAVIDASNRKVAESFAKLENAGIVEQCQGDRHERTVSAYLQAAAAGERTLIVSELRADVAALNERLSAELQARGVVQDIRQVPAFVVRDLLDAEKRIPESYRVGDYVRFTKKHGVYRAGALAQVVHVSAEGIVLDNGDGRGRRVSFSSKAAFQVLEEKSLAIGRGTQLQIKLNANAEGGRLVNGELVTVRAVRADGAIEVEGDDGRRVLTRELCQFLLGYAVTSYSSQGKTVDRVILSDSGSEPATNRKAWYVSISRARRAIQIFTDNASDLRRRIAANGDRELAIDTTVDLPRQAPELNAARRWFLVRMHVHRLKQTVKRRIHQWQAS
jgi:conjugative relaxase-like TrwC/TraI family protein